MTTKREQAMSVLRQVFTSDVQIHALADAIEIMGQPEPEVAEDTPACGMSKGGFWCLKEDGHDGDHRFATKPEPAPEPEEPLDTSVCKAMGKHLTMAAESHCFGPGYSYAGCFPWSTSELGVGAMLAWLHEQDYCPILTNYYNGQWGVDCKSETDKPFPETVADTPQAALANAVVAVGEKDA